VVGSSGLRICGGNLFCLFRGTPEAPPRKMNVRLFRCGERLSESIVPGFLLIFIKLLMFIVRDRLEFTTLQQKNDYFRLLFVTFDYLSCF
jgi:hypothetical protein